MAGVVYALCSLTAFLCSGLLFRGYTRSGARLLLWSSLCFLGLTVNNVLVFVDLQVLSKEASILLWRNVSALAAMSLLLYGLIWDSK